MKKDMIIRKAKPVLNARIGLEETGGQTWSVNKSISLCISLGRSKSVATNSQSSKSNIPGGAS
jgi:hypothetical protein